MNSTTNENINPSNRSWWLDEKKLTQHFEEQNLGRKAITTILDYLVWIKNYDFKTATLHLDNEADNGSGFKLSVSLSKIDSPVETFTFSDVNNANLFCKAWGFNLDEIKPDIEYNITDSLNEQLQILKDNYSL